MLMVHEIVTQASAGLTDKILKANHHNVCKFDTQFGGYMPVLTQLKRIRALLLGRSAGDSENANESQNVRA